MVRYLYTCSIIHAYKINIIHIKSMERLIILNLWIEMKRVIHLHTFCFFKFLSFHLSLLFGDFGGDPQGPSHKSACRHRSGLRAGLVGLEKLCNVHTGTGLISFKLACITSLIMTESHEEIGNVLFKKRKLSMIQHFTAHRLITRIQMSINNVTLFWSHEGSFTSQSTNQHV